MVFRRDIDSVQSCNMANMKHIEGNPTVEEKQGRITRIYFPANPPDSSRTLGFRVR
jgi:hypothetical protein